MSTTNIDHRLDLAIDALNREQAPAANDGELASLVNAARLIKSLRPPAEPDAGFPALALDRIMASLDQPVALAAEPPLDDDPPRGITGWLHKYSELAAILVIGLVVIGGIFIYQTVWSDDGGAPAAEPPELIEGFDVYRVTGTTESAAHLQQIDPETLDDIEAGHRFDITFPYVLSQDGSTVVWIETGPNQERIIVVGDGLGGSEQLRFQPPVWTGSPILSNDGSRLLLMGRLEAGSEPPFWYIYDTATGELVSTIQRDSRLGMDQIFFSPDGATLYQVWTAPANSPDAPEPLQIITYDTSSGEKTGTVSLSDVPAGYGNLDPMIQVQESTFLRPTAIISPNGNIIAISHADQHIITIVNAETLEIEKSFSLDIPTSTPDEPSPAPYARSEIVFTPDSSQLYFFGWVVGSLPSANQFGLMLVDIEQGAIVATGQEGLQVQHILPTPDGESLYVFSTQPFALGIDDEQIIHRLDASTLEIEAERSFVEFNVIIIDPMPRERPDQPPAPPAPTNDPDAFPTPDELGMYRNLTFEQAQELVSFELIQPSVVPAPLEFAGIFVTTPPRPNPDGTIVFDDPVEVIAIYRDSRDGVPGAPFAEFRQGTHAVSITNPDAVETNVEIGGHAIAKFRMEREDGVVVTNWLWESAGMHYTITARSLSEEFEIAIEEMIAALPPTDE